MIIKNIKAREILDSRGTPTVEVIIDSGVSAVSSVPSGASTGINEAFELWDGAKNRYFGMGVLKAVSNIAPALIGTNVFNQATIDELLIELDGTYGIQ